MNKLQQLRNRAMKVDLKNRDRIEKILESAEMAAEDGAITYQDRDAVIEVMRARAEGRKVK